MSHHDDIDVGLLFALPIFQPSQGSLIVPPRSEGRKDKGGVAVVELFFLENIGGLSCPEVGTGEESAAA